MQLGNQRGRQPQSGAAAQHPLLFSQTSKIEIAAGVIPEIRDACPIDDGLWSFSLAITSLDSPVTWR